MTKTFIQIAAFALAAVVTTVTVAGTDALAAQQYAKAGAQATTTQVAQQAVATGRRAA